MEVKVENLAFAIGGKEIISQVHIEANQNRFIGVIGPNGSGKSTLLKCMYRVQKQSEGEIFLNDKNCSTYSVKETAKMLAVVSQHNFYNFDFKIEEVVLMGRSPHKRMMERDNANDYKIVDDCLEKVGMTALKGRSFATLSGGEQQRVILARALAQQTDCIILDEPTNHLDIKYQLQLLDIVKSLEVTVVSAIHDLNIAAMYCDYLYAMKDGRIVCQGTVEQVITPENILHLFEVHADVQKDAQGNLRVSYYPHHRKELAYA